MISAEELSGLLGTLYAAPLEPEKWQEFMRRLCAVTSVSCGCLIGSHGDGGEILAGGGPRFDPEMFRLYAEHYSTCDPYSAPLLQHPRIGLVEGDELLDRGELLKTELYNDLIEPRGLASTTVVISACNHEQLEGLSLWRGPKQGAMDADSQRLLRMLVPHLQTALRLRASVLERERTQVFSETAMEAMSIAAFLVTGGGRVRHRNRLAERYVGKGEGLQLCGGKLVASDSAKAAQLEMLLAAATFGRAAGLEWAPGGAMQVLRPASGSQLQVTVVPAPEGSDPASRERYAVVFVSDPAATPLSRAAWMRQLYNLTATECRLADLLLEGMEVREAAERLRITIETARFHLKRVFSKTGVGRQVELIRLMMLLPGAEETGVRRVESRTAYI